MCPLVNLPENFDLLLEIDVADMKTQLDVNVIGTTLCCKLAVNSMLKRGVTDGHVINMNR